MPPTLAIDDTGDLHPAHAESERKRLVRVVAKRGERSDFYDLAESQLRVTMPFALRPCYPARLRERAIHRTLLPMVSTFSRPVAHVVRVRTEPKVSRIDAARDIAAM
jgi:hypothetical protein